MEKKIFYGEAEVYNKATKKTEFIQGLIFKEGDNQELKRDYVLKHVNPAQRNKYQIIRFKFETAKCVGITIY